MVNGVSVHLFFQLIFSFKNIKQHKSILIIFVIFYFYFIIAIFYIMFFLFIKSFSANSSCREFAQK